MEHGGRLPQMLPAPSSAATICTQPLRQFPCNFTAHLAGRERGEGAKRRGKHDTAHYCVSLSENWLGTQRGRPAPDAPMPEAATGYKGPVKGLPFLNCGVTVGRIRHFEDLTECSREDYVGYRSDTGTVNRTGVEIKNWSEFRNQIIQQIAVNETAKYQQTAKRHLTPVAGSQLVISGVLLGNQSDAVRCPYLYARDG
ncbi:hypothetical protein EVAR_21550_1 [Eumeta japonica]|uniref:Uncharacterized protein n=1 Tax=Eumeta variegata TaxID=151549 RepID=A0A4C1XM74_EUMVA|nr:hypothetical protein EVAR_21550_1 [Eumeta japonica]